MATVLVFFGLLAGALVVAHHVIRFGGGEAEFSLESRVESADFNSERQVKFMRKRGDTVELNFELDASKLPTFDNQKILMGQFSPKLVLMTEGGETRSSCRVAVYLKDANSDWNGRRILKIHEGRSQRFEFRLPAKVNPSKLIAKVENRSKGYLVKFAQKDLQLVTGTNSHSAGIMRAALALALLSSVLASFALFFREQMSLGPSLMASFGVVVLTISMEVLEFGVLAEASENLREALVSTVSTLLPDAGRYDVIQRLERGRDVGWEVTRELAVRFVIGAVLLGVVDGWITGRRKLA